MEPLLPGVGKTPKNPWKKWEGFFTHPEKNMGDNL